MNRINNFLMTLCLSGTLFFAGLMNIDTDRRVVPVVEKIKVFYYDVVAQHTAERQGAFDAVVLLYNNSGHGTGFFITNKVILTNHHMVAQRSAFGGIAKETNDEVTVQFRNGEQHTARVIKSNPDMDIAMLELNDGSEAPAVLNIAQEAPVDGERVYVAGNGGFDFFWAKGGYIRGSYKFNGLWKNTQSLAFMKSKGGFSGSPVISNATGQVVGVHAGGFTTRALTIHVPLEGIRMFLKQTPQEANPYISSSFSQSSGEWYDFPELRGHTANFRAYASHLEDVSPEAVLEYTDKYGIRIEYLEDGAKFSGPSQAVRHLLQHVYFKEPLKRLDKTILSILYVPLNAIQSDMHQPLRQFCEDNRVNVVLHEQTERVIFQSSKEVLLVIADYIFRGGALP